MAQWFRQIHNLLRLVELTKLPISNRQRAILGRFNQYQLEGRYPDRLPKPIPKKRAKVALKEGEEIREWLKKQF